MFIKRAKILQFLMTGRFMTPENYLRSKGVEIGVGCSIAPCRLSAKEGYLIKIGNYCRIARDTVFFTHGGLYSLRFLYNDPNVDYFGKIEIGDYVSIEEDCKILPGVKIGNRVTVGAGSIVTKSIPDGWVVAGNPCKHVGYTEEWYHKVKEMDLQTKLMGNDEKKKFLLSLPDDKFVQKPMMKQK
jgi:acetyltransferase-like isoleucine patch superfamily enzyme